MLHIKKNSFFHKTIIQFSRISVGFAVILHQVQGKFIPVFRSIWFFQGRFHRKARGFTLIELLIVIAILSILATITLLVINPAQMVKQSRDANRIAEINQINKALLIFQSFGGSEMGTHTKVYVSIPSDEADCSDLGLPTLGGGYTYACKPTATYRNIDSTGWVPADLASIQSQAGSLFFALPIDPVNTVANGYYYTYVPGSWALSATMESDKYIAANAANDGGSVSTRFEVGNELTLNSNLGSDSAVATVPSNIVLAVGSTAPVGGVTNVAIPAAGATDTTGAVIDWVASTADKIKFTVTDGGAAVSTITIGGVAYTSGADYAIPSTSDLSIVVTTTESGKTTCVRTFTVTVAAWICGDTLTDSRDDKTYDTVLIGSQCWMAENLDYDDGCSSITWVNSLDAGWCGYYTGGPFANEGLLYQWSAAMDGSTTAGSQGICPTGWHIPTDAEWKILVEGQATAGCESSTGWQCSPAGSHLSDYTLNHDNTSGFSGILAGYRGTAGSFYYRSSGAYVWSSVESGGNAWTRTLASGYATVYRNANSKAIGYSVRCLKD